MSLNHDTRTGHEIWRCAVGGAHLMKLRRYRDGVYEDLFVARFKHHRASAMTTRYMKALKRDMGAKLATCTQVELDTYRVNNVLRIRRELNGEA